MSVAKRNKEIITLSHVDNDIASIHSYEEAPAESLAVLFNLVFAPDNVLPILFDCSTNRKVDINVLRRKNMVLLFSTPDISESAIRNLRLLRSNTCTIVWIPIAQRWNPSLQQTVRQKRTAIPGYSIECFVPMPRATNYICDVWGYDGRHPRLVLLDRTGNLKMTGGVSKISERNLDAFPFWNRRR